jgi:hypothetical protein
VALKGNFNPLIGCSCNVDLVGSALAAIPYIGFAVSRLVKLYKKLSHNDFSLNISISNQLSFSFDITKKASSEKFEISAPPALNKFALKLTAEIKSQKGNWFLSLAGSKHGGGMEGTASINIYLNKPINTLYGFDIPSEFEFTGISIVTFNFVKSTSVYSGTLPDDENFEFEKEYEDTAVKNWLATEKMPFVIPVLAC